MLDFSRVQNYYIACGYTDMRKQIDGLAALVQTQFGQEMDETSLYLFCGRRADRIKALYWDGTGYILLYKRLTEKRFQWPRTCGWTTICFICSAYCLSAQSRARTLRLKICSPGQKK